MVVKGVRLRLRQQLRQYWKRYRPAIWLFPNRAKNGPLSRAQFSKFSERPNGHLAEDLNRSRAWISPRRARAMRLNKAMNMVRYSQQICLP